MRRGEVWLVQFDPARGTEAGKTRPAVIVSNDEANTTATRLGRGVVTVVPVTGNTDRVYSFQVFIDRGHAGLDRDSKAQPEQVRAVDASRLLHRLGAVSPQILADIGAALRFHLDLDD